MLTSNNTHNTRPLLLHLIFTTLSPLHSQAQTLPQTPPSTTPQIQLLLLQLTLPQILPLPPVLTVSFTVPQDTTLLPPQQAPQVPDEGEATLKTQTTTTLLS